MKAERMEIWTEYFSERWRDFLLTAVCLAYALFCFFDHAAVTGSGWLVAGFLFLLQGAQAWSAKSYKAMAHDYEKLSDLWKARYYRAVGEEPPDETVSTERIQ